MVSHDGPVPGVRYYELARPPLAHIDMVEFLRRAVEDARRGRPETAINRFRGHIGCLLPSHARTSGERWQPTPKLPHGHEARAVRDEWTRLGAYVGALDSWLQTNARGPQGPGIAAWDFAAAYSTAYSLVRMFAAQTEVPRG